MQPHYPTATAIITGSGGSDAPTRADGPRRRAG